MFYPRTYINYNGETVDLPTKNSDEKNTLIFVTTCVINKNHEINQEMRINEVKENISIEIDGNKFHNLDGFFCTLGEEVNGIGGYFGRGVYALSDCMHGDFGVNSISELKWLNHKRSKKLFKTKFDEILQVFADHNVKVILE